MTFGSTRDPQSTIGTSFCERVEKVQARAGLLSNTSLGKAPHLFYPWEFGEEPWEFQLGSSGAERLVGNLVWRLNPSDAGKNNLSRIECSELFPDSKPSNCEYKR